MLSLVVNSRLQSALLALSREGSFEGLRHARQCEGLPSLACPAPHSSPPPSDFPCNLCVLSVSALHSYPVFCRANTHEPRMLILPAPPFPGSARSSVGVYPGPVRVPRMIPRGESKAFLSSAPLRVFAKFFPGHTSKISPVTPVVATDPKTLSR